MTDYMTKNKPQFNFKHFFKGLYIYARAKFSKKGKTIN